MTVPARIAGSLASLALSTDGRHTGLMSSLVFEYPLLILERHLDTFGHVNNATYLEIFEEARWDAITRGGHGLDVIKATGQGPVVLECTVRFRRELTSRVNVTVGSRVTAYAGKVGRMHQEIRLADGNVACDAEFTFGFFDLQRRKLIDPSPAWLATFGLTVEDWQVGAKA